MVDDEGYAGQEYLSLYETVDLGSYSHQPRRVREQARFDRDRLLDALGVRRPPFGRPMH